MVLDLQNTPNPLQFQPDVSSTVLRGDDDARQARMAHPHGLSLASDLHVPRLHSVSHLTGSLRCQLIHDEGGGHGADSSHTQRSHRLSARAISKHAGTAHLSHLPHSHSAFTLTMFLYAFRRPKH